MSFATSYEPASRYGIGTRGNAFGRRLAIIVALVSSDLLCFALADTVLHLFRANMAIAPFRGGFSGAHNTAMDLLVIIAVIFVVARYIIGDYSRRRLFWDGARATTG